MAQKVTTNTFNKGMVMDIEDLNVSNDITIKALNATLATYNGHEGVLLNDSGNIEIPNAALNGIPIGSVEFGGVIYIASIIEETLLDGTTIYKGEIGSFPSPDYSDSTATTLLYVYAPLKVGTVNSTAANLTTTFFNFDYEHPVTMVAEAAFDGSVNLIITDNKNVPRIINTGFSVQNNNTYLIINRYGTNNTNTYSLDNSNVFDILTALTKNTSQISKFVFNGLLTGGLLLVGNYVFYAIVCDKDGNESDIICESGMIPVFLGTDTDPFSVKGGIQDERSDKSISITIENIDTAYNYIKLYYSRTTGADNSLPTTFYYKLDTKYLVTNNTCNILITGFENSISTDYSSINIQYFNANKAKTIANNLNMLFVGNIEQESGDLYYELLKQLSLRFTPILVSDTTSFDLEPDYTSKENNNYYSSTFIYEKTGYHAEEYYRFGIVYIKNDNSLTSVFDVLGITPLTTSVDTPETYENFTDTEYIYGKFNSKGVCRFSANTSITEILGIKFYVTKSTITSLSNYGIKGYFFVRQKRMPTIVAQGYTTNICETAYVPSITLKHNNSNRYVYESFVTGGYTNGVDTQLGDSTFFANKATSNLRLRNSYLPRLFSLTDNCYAYFDKLGVGTDNPISYYYNTYIGGVFDSDLWFSNLFYADLFGDNDDDFLVLTCTNSAGKADKYNVKLFFFCKVESNKTINCDGISITIPSSVTTGEGGNAYAGSSMNDNFTVTDGDDDLTTVIKWASDSYAKEEYKLNNGNWTLNMPTWIYFSGNYYIFYDAVGFRESYLSRINNKMNEYLSRYSTNTTLWAYKALNGEIKDGTISNTTNKGYDLTVPTYDGKYSYTSKNEDDYAAFKCSPVEYGAYGMFCPEYELNLPYYNSLFTGLKFKSKVIADANLSESSTDVRLYTTNTITMSETETLEDTYALAIGENITLNKIDHTEDIGTDNYLYHKHYRLFASQVGTPLEVNFKFAGPEFLAYNSPTEITVETKDNKLYIPKDTNYKVPVDKPFNLLRGQYSPYVGICPITENKTGRTDYDSKIVNIYIPLYSLDKNDEYIKLRANDSSVYYAISDRMTLPTNFTNNTTTTGNLFRGDCFINYFTHRVSRNFNDSSAPYNDIIIDPTTFSKNFIKLLTLEYRKFDLSRNAEAAASINIGDLNAVQIGSWVTFPIRTSINTALRTTDGSNILEKTACGQDKAFYPLRSTDASGSNKIAESWAYNLAFSKSGGDKTYVNLAQTVYLKSYYKNRILYSNILLSDSISNGNRVFISTHFKDYTDLYGEIVKLISLSSYLLCVCEHGILLIPVNERALAAEALGGNVFINTSNVLPDNPNVLSDTYGSKYPDSIIQTPYGVFGVDVDANKIWKCDGSTVTVISDFKVLEFLNDYLKNGNIDLRTFNIKSHYNQIKNDVMFTLYDTINNNYWNLCWNLNQDSWVTFYSWIPMLSANIDNTLITTNALNLQDLKLYKHGFFNRIPTSAVQPCYWYGSLHPFEFEFIVKEDAYLHKIFDNLYIIANNVPPESFHYEIIGDCFNFAEDKPNMYKRQEVTREMLANGGGSSISYTPYNKAITKHPVSTVFPLYYYRSKDSNNPIYDVYKLINNPSGYSYDMLTGTEVLYNKNLDTFSLCTHAKGVDLSSVTSISRGNMIYREDIWKVQINPINLVQKNETWIHEGIIPIVTNSIKTDDIMNKSFSEDKLPTGYTASDVVVWDFSKLKEVKIKDKYIKIRVRYTGDKVTLVSAISTLYTLSYS